MPLVTINDLLTSDPQEVEDTLQLGRQLSTLFEDYLDDDSGDGGSRLPGLHASEISGCARKSVYALIGEERKRTSPGIAWKKRFLVGHAIHGMFQRAFHEMTKKKYLHITFEEELTIAPELQPMAAKWNIQSHCDGVFTIRESWNGPVILRVALEIKTKSPTEFEKLTKPEESHVEQAHVYMACLDVPVTWMLYYNKGNQNFTGSTNPNFFVKFDQNKWAELEARFATFHDHAQKGILPLRTESVVCEFCPFSWTCKPAYLNKKKGSLPTMPNTWGRK